MNDAKRLEFSTNWNAKLFGNYFTTLRLSGRFYPGDRVEVWLKKEILGVVEVQDKKRLVNRDQLNEWVCAIDTGYSRAETFNILETMYPNIKDWSEQPVYLYLLKYVQRTLGESPNP